MAMKIHSLSRLETWSFWSLNSAIAAMPPRRSPRSMLSCIQMPRSWLILKELLFALGTFVNSPKHDGPECIEPLASAP